ncbi:MAG: CHAP domain-containing protein [Cryobacterium sp.]
MPLTRRELRAQREAGEAPEQAQAPAGAPAELTAVVAATQPVVGLAALATVAPKAIAKAAVRPAAKPVAARPHRSKRNSPLTMAFTLLAIPGLFLTAALPAYAFVPGEGVNGASSARERAAAEAQAVTFDATAVSIEVARDGFSATTPAQIAERARADAAKKAAADARVAAASAAAAYAVYGIRADGDDYPWAGRTSGLSELGYVYGQCVDFVAWRLNRDAGATGGNWRWTWSNLTPNGGDASQWANAWSSHGWATSSTPVVGAVAWFNYNHVAYVQSISGDSVVLEEYNWMGSSAYHTRTVPISEVPKFLYPPA